MIFALSKPDRTLKILGFMTTVLLWSSTLPAMPELPHHNDSDGFLGIETCGSSTCHGSPEPWRNATVLMKERILWEHSDPHSDAYETLQSNRAKSIAKTKPQKRARSPSMPNLSCYLCARRSKRRKLYFVIRSDL